MAVLTAARLFPERMLACWPVRRKKEEADEGGAWADHDSTHVLLATLQLCMAMHTQCMVRATPAWHTV